MTYKSASLPPEILRIVQDKGTEYPFSGEYDQTDAPGTYLCRQCGLALFRSETKFHSGCGWPSFDQAIPGSVKEVTDNSHGMVRTEVICSNCGAHLGHVFNDGPKETTGMRFCINSASLGFMPQDKK